MEKNKKKKIICNIILSICIFSILFILQKIFKVGIKDYIYDVEHYNSIGTSLFSRGHYSISTISTGFRGYVFPSFMGLCSFIDTKLNVSYSIYVLSSLIFTILFMVYFNFCIEIFKFNKKNNYFYILRCIFTVVLTIIFFYGLIIYPLTDLYAALICIDSGYLLYKAIKLDGIKKIVMYFLAGMMIYLAYNIRTIYQLTIYLFVIVIAVYEFKKSRIRNVIFSNLAYGIGVMVGAIPQFMINYNLQRFISPWINNGNLFAQQLFWGLEYPRYATAIGKNAGGLFFVDNIGFKIATEWTDSGLPITIGTYIKFFFKYPLEYIGIFGRHFYNCLFILYPEQYIKNIDKNTIILALLGLVIIFIFFITLYVNLKKNRFDWKKLIFIIALTFPSFAIIFGAVEERFMILPYLLIYGFISFFDYSKLKKYINKRNIIITTIIFIIFLGTMITIESGIMGSLKDYPLYFNN